jgi:hypothetical protein
MLRCHYNLKYNLGSVFLENHSTLFLFRSNEDNDSTITKKENETRSEENEASFYCALCENKITDVSQITNVNGQHRHVYSNPAGNVFEIGCFNSAAGCINEGIPTGECTWFAGFDWCYSICGNCKLHLGWKYISQGHGNFWGLILNRLVCQ